MKNIYDQMYLETLHKIQGNQYKLDKQINDPRDSRYGLSLIIEPDAAICSNILQFLSELKTIEPNQYIYPSSDIHITVLSIISCYSGFNTRDVPLEKYIVAVKKSLSGVQSFSISFKGITASPSGVMVQGFVDNDSLTRLRGNLREEFRNNGLENSIDKRYEIQTAHTTVLRFQYPLQQKIKFLAVLNQSRGKDFGEMKVNELRLVGNDWYHRRDKVELLSIFPLTSLL
ncbi:2'-5' RNA ligase family protein [Litoribacter ruber]|nr:mutarotase [Litoribacter alkaliphilus]